MDAIAFLKKHSERAALIGLGIAFLFFVGGGIYLQKQNKNEANTVAEEKEITRVELTVRQQAGGSGQANKGETGSNVTTTAFFLKPSPQELLEQLSGMDNLREDVAKRKFLSLRVLWPVYFFVLEQHEGEAVANFDVSEDGFGVEVKSNLSLAAFPEINELQPGDRLWLGGEIVGVDLSGTGVIYIETEQVSLSEELPTIGVEVKTDSAPQ